MLLAIPVSFTYFIQRVASRFFFNFIKFFFLALFLTVVVAIIYYFIPKKETILPTRTPPSPYAPIRGVTRARYRRKPIGAVRPLNKASKAKRLAEKKKKRQDILNKAVKR
jgi:hypothetical protein